VPEVQLCLGRGAESETPLQEQVRAAAEAGFRCLDLWLPALDDYLASYPSVVLVALLQQHGLYVGMVSGLPTLPLGESAGSAHTQGRFAKRAYEPFTLLQARLLALCVELDTLGGGTVLLPLSPSSADGPQPTAPDRVVRTLADLTAPFETRLALTPLPGDGGNVSTLAAIAALVERAGRPNVGLGLDLAAGDVPVAIPAAFSRRLWAVRLGVADWGQEKEGQLRALCAQLASAGYRGPYSVAPMPGAASPVEGARKAKEAVQT